MKSILLQIKQCNRVIFSDWLGKQAVCLMAIGLPFSTAMVSIGMVLTSIAFLLRGAWDDAWQQIKTQPFIKGIALLFVLVSIGVFYSRAPWSLIGENYQDIFKLTLFLYCAPFLKSPRFRKNLFIVFTIAVSVLLVLSDLKYFGFIDLGRQYARSAVFKDYQINALLYSILAFTYCLLSTAYPNQRKIFLSLAALFIIQTIFINEGRIGYCYISLLLLYYGWTVGCWRGLLKGLALLVVIFSCAYQVSPNFNSRMTLLFSELHTYQAVSQNSPASLHLRINFALNTLKLIEQKPWFGYGTGSFSPVYEQQSEQLGWVKTNNPHNYYLLITMQYGLLGLACLILFFAYLWRQTARLPQLERHLGRGVLLTYSLGCLYNSMLMDYTETIFFAILMSLTYVAYQPLTRTTSLTTFRHITVH